LDRSIGNQVPSSGAAVSLESVEKTHPVTNLMGDGTAKVVWRKSSTWDGIELIGGTAELNKCQQQRKSG